MRIEIRSTPQVQDKTLIRLVNVIYDKYPESRPLSSPLAPRCGFESLYAISDPQETSRLHFRLYPRVGELLTKTRERAATLAKGSKALSAILPKKRFLHNVAEEPGFVNPLTLNPNFSCLAENKTISKKRMGSESFFKLEGCWKALLESNSYTLWLMSGLLSQLKRDGFASSEPTLFDCHFIHLMCVGQSDGDNGCYV